MPPVISILHATAQPVTCEDTARRWLESASDPMSAEHLLAWETGFFTQPPDSPFYNHKVFSVTGSPVIGWNTAASLATGNIFVMIADDLYPSLDWDKALIDAIPNDQSEAVVWVKTLDDAGNELWPSIITHPVVTKAYVQRYGYLLHPAYFARFSDLEFSDKAKDDGVVIDKKSSIVWRHENHQLPGDWHPSSQKINRLHEADNETYNRRSTAGFPREWAAFSAGKSMSMS